MNRNRLVEKGCSRSEIYVSKIYVVEPWGVALCCIPESGNLR